MLPTTPRSRRRSMYSSLNWPPSIRATRVSESVELTTRMLDMRPHQTGLWRRISVEILTFRNLRCETHLLAVCCIHPSGEKSRCHELCSRNYHQKNEERQDSKVISVEQKPSGKVEQNLRNL